MYKNGFHNLHYAYTSLLIQRDSKMQISGTQTTCMLESISTDFQKPHF